MLGSAVTLCFFIAANQVAVNSALRVHGGPVREKSYNASSQPSQLRKQFSDLGYVEFPSGFPWQWGIMRFAEDYYTRFNELIVRELEELRPHWYAPALVPGAFAAQYLTEKLRPFGVRVFASSLPSVANDSRDHVTGPRFYISVDMALCAAYGTVPPAPDGFRQFLGAGPQRMMLRNFGWVLSPPGSDPQILHTDYEYGQPHGSIAHITWKHPGQHVTTELNPGLFGSENCKSEELVTISAEALVFDSNVCHRGAATTAEGWSATFSIEVATNEGRGYLDATDGFTNYLISSSSEEWTCPHLKVDLAAAQHAWEASSGGGFGGGGAQGGYSGGGDFGGGHFGGGHFGGG